MVFTGGEPTVHPHWEELLQASDRLGMVNLMVTNGSTLSPRTIEKFAKSSLSGVIISIDSQDLMVHEKNRGLKGVTQKIKEQLPLLKKSGVGATASVTLNRLLTDFDSLPDTLTDLPPYDAGFQLSRSLRIGSGDLHQRRNASMDRPG